MKKLPHKITQEKVKEIPNITVEHKIDLQDIFSNAVKKYGAKKVMKVLGWSCGMDYLHMGLFPMSLLATESDAEALQTMFIVKYAIDNWEKISIRALKHWNNKYNKKEHNCDNNKSTF
jgi:hypothetical protein